MAADSFLRELSPLEQFQLTSYIETAIEKSLDDDVNVFSKAEIKDRFNLCLGLAAQMRRDLGWSWARIRDTLPGALKVHVNGGTWAPSDRNAWVTDASSGLILPPSAK